MRRARPSLSELRLSRGLTQSQVGIAQRHVSDFELGKRLPGPKSVKLIAEYLTKADAKHPVCTMQVMAACQESQRRAKADQAAKAFHALNNSACPAQRPGQGAR